MYMQAINIYIYIYIHIYIELYSIYVYLIPVLSYLHTCRDRRTSVHSSRSTAS